MKNTLRKPVLCRTGIFFLFFQFAILTSFTQNDQRLVDSLEYQLSLHPKKDTTRIDILAWLAVVETIDMDKKTGYLQEAVNIAKSIHSNREHGLWVMLGWAYMNMDDYPRSIEAFQEIFKISKPETEIYSSAIHFIGMNYKAQGDWAKALTYTKAGHEMDLRIIAKGKTLVPQNKVGTPWNLGEIYFKMNVLDTALLYGRRAYMELNNVDQGVRYQFEPLITTLLGNIFIALGQKDSAIHYINESYTKVGLSYSNGNLQIADFDLAKAKWCVRFGSLDSAIVYGTKAFDQAKINSRFEVMFQAASVMRTASEKMKNYSRALEFNDLAIAIKDSMLGLDKIKKTQAMHYDMQLKDQQANNLKKELTLNNRIRLLGLSSLFIGFAGIFLYRNNQMRRKTITQLNEQNTIIESQKSQLHTYIDELKEKQSQLIHSEKMASLGELTAGIAHEIQNPLNFVNNFSEINKELIFELKHEIHTGKEKSNPGAVENILNDMEQNTSKIYLHGKRAESIVRSMLEHSQSKSGEKVKTDINALTEEYLKLSYHAIRAKEKEFNANLITDLDPSIPLLSIIPSDIGRVLINVFNNAFYSMNEKEKKSGNGYHPTLKIKSSLKDHQISLIIRDNGQGIPEKIRSKIFQPFFTTKSTGNGTGLGLSLSYDIITKAHHGVVTVDSVEGEYSEFNILLPA